MFIFSSSSSNFSSSSISSCSTCDIYFSLRSSLHTGIPDKYDPDSTIPSNFVWFWRCPTQGHKETHSSRWCQCKFRSSDKRYPLGRQLTARDCVRKNRAVYEMICSRCHMDSMVMRWFDFFLFRFLLLFWLVWFLVGFLFHIRFKSH